MGDQFAAEGLGQQALVEPVEQMGGAGGLGGQPVDAGEGGFDAADDLTLLIQVRSAETECLQLLQSNSRPRRAMNEVASRSSNVAEQQHELGTSAIDTVAVDPDTKQSPC